MAYKVGIYCGHGRSTDGSWDPGTTYQGETEAALMLPITKALVKYMRASGVSVYTDSDACENNNINMVKQVAEANAQKVDVFVSIHCDYYKAPSGTMPLYYPGSTNGKKLATCLNDAVKNGMKMKTRGVTGRADLYELKETNMTACVFETGSIKNDLKILKKSDAYGKALAKGLCAYLGIKFKTTKTTTAKKKYTGKIPSLTTGIAYKRPTSTKYWQKFLNWAIGAKLSADGVFGTKTADATKKFQKLVGITADGIAGAKTYKAAKAFKK